jgi:hypothetical protein
MMQDGVMQDGSTWASGLGTVLLVLFIVAVMVALIRYIFFDQ